MSLAREGLPVFDLTTYREGHLSPVYFGSALKNFGVAELAGRAGGVCAAARATRPRSAAAVEPADEEVTGFVFKVQANMDPNHRDRVAFLRLCLGRFRRGMKLKQSGTGKTISVHNPILFFAAERETVDEAWPGDIIGIPNHGVLRVGDTLSESGEVIFTGIPNFAPEILRRVRLGRSHEAEAPCPRPGKPRRGRRYPVVQAAVIGTQWIVGVVGALQLDVLQSRLRDEYGLDVDAGSLALRHRPLAAGRAAEDLEKFRDANEASMAVDRDGAAVFLAKSAWELGYVGDKFPRVKFLKTRERHPVVETA